MATTHSQINLADAVVGGVSRLAKRNGFELPDIKPTGGFYTTDGFAETMRTNSPELYACPECQDTGYIIRVDDHGRRLARECKCMITKRNKRRIELSGLADIVSRCTFDTYKATEPWQRVALRAAQDYVANPSGWFYVGGVSGCGKTHICTAICGDLMQKGISVRYVSWRDVATELKGTVNDPEGHQDAMDRLLDIKCLYIDDFYKTGTARGQSMYPTIGDINAAFDIINARYQDARKLTIISSEMTIDELRAVDAAIAGRIIERSGRHMLYLRGAKDWRTSHAP